jgi:hypothetical protein
MMMRLEFVLLLEVQALGLMGKKYRLTVLTVQMLMERQNLLQKL